MSDSAAPTVALERVTLSVDGAVAAVIRLDRPGKLNAIDLAMLAGLENALREADADPRVRAILVTGSGRAFSAGADLKTYLTFQHDAAEVERFVGEFQRVYGSIRLLAKPVLALVNGIAAAGGLELALSCDFVYAAASARLGDAHLVYGQLGGGGALTLLPRLIGPARARELLFSARLLTAEEALAWGLVNAVHPDADLLQAGIEFAEGVATRSPVAVAGAKAVLNAGWAEGTGVEASLVRERARAVHHNLTSADAAEGLRAFAEGRAPRFTGR